MMNTQLKPSSVIFAKDLEKMANFYQALFSMQNIFQDDIHILLDSDGFQVVIHSMPDAIAQTIAVTEPPELRQQMPVKLCLPVKSIAAARESAASLGGGIKSITEEWKSHKFIACDGFDPEGNLIQVREELM